MSVQSFALQNLSRYLLWSGLKKSTPSEDEHHNEPTGTEADSKRFVRETLERSAGREKKREEREAKIKPKPVKEKKKPYEFRRGKRTRTMSERSLVERKRTRASSSLSEPVFSPTASQILRSDKIEQREIVRNTLIDLVESVDLMLDNLSKRKVALTLATKKPSLYAEQKAAKIELIDQIKRSEWSLKPLRLQLLQVLQLLDAGAEVDSSSTDSLVSRFLFLQSQLDHLN